MEWVAHPSLLLAAVSYSSSGSDLDQLYGGGGGSGPTLPGPVSGLQGEGPMVDYRPRTLSPQWHSPVYTGEAHEWIDMHDAHRCPDVCRGGACCACQGRRMSCHASRSVLLKIISLNEFNARAS